MLNLLQKFLKIKAKCTCGSGGHPRRCRIHPWAFQQHVFELNHDIVRDDTDDLIIRVDKLEAELASLKKIVDQIDKIQNEMLDK